MAHRTNRETFSVEQGIPISDTRPMLGKSRPPVFESHNIGKPRRCGNRCCRCCCYCCAVLSTLIILFGIAALIFYLVVKPKVPIYSVNSISIKGFNSNLLTSQTISPEFDVSISANNPNTKIGIHYVPTSSVAIYSSTLVELSNGTLPVFYQPTQNVTVINVKMTGTVPLTTALSSTLEAEQRAGKIRLVLDSNVPVKLKIGSLNTQTYTIKVSCIIVVNSLSTNSSMVSKSCIAI